MAARVFLLSILFTEVLRPACFAGTRGASGGIRGLNLPRSEILELERSGGLNSKPKIEPAGNVVVGRKGVKLKCSVGGNQSVSWLRNGQAAPPCGLVQCSQPRKGVLHFDKIAQKPGERGNTGDKIQTPDSYRCVSNSSSGALRSVPVLVHIGHLSREFKEPPKDVIVHEEEVARLSCLIDSTPAAEISWQRDGQPLSFVDETKYFVVSPGVLYINATKLSDAGSYRCSATNKFVKGPKRSKETKLSVMKIEGEKPDARSSLFPQISYDYQLINGSNITLVCASSGFPSLVLWTFTPRSKDGAAIEQPRLLLNSTHGIAALKLKHVTTEDAGIYQCSVKSLGRIHETQNIAVTVLEPPTFRIRPELKTVPNGRSVQFECEAKGFPVPQIYWLKNSVRLPPDPRARTFAKGNTEVLSVLSTIPNDSGIYQCVAVNAAGEIWAPARLTVNSSSQSPPVPTSVNCQSKSSDQILVSWELPKISSAFENLTHVTVHFAAVGLDSDEDIRIPDQNTSNFTLKGLQPYTNYTIYVRIWIARGPDQGESSPGGVSNQSKSVQCVTAMSVPTAALVITTEPISSTKLNVSWMPLGKREARGPIVVYKLQWRLDNRSSSRVRNISSALTQYILTDLIPGKRYEVRLLASTEKGWPNVSDSQLQWTTVTMPTTDVVPFSLENLVNLYVTNVNESTIRVKWKFDGKTAEIDKNFDSWQLHYQNDAGKKLSTPLLPKNHTEYLLTELEAGALYEIKFCVNISGKPEVCISRQLNSETPIGDHAPVDLEGVPASSTSINITWSAVAHRYTVCYKAVYTGDSAAPRCFNTTDVRTTVRGLEPYTLYEFKVSALHNTSDYRSIRSETIECYTDEDVPGPVNIKTGYGLNSTWANIIWTPPSKLNGVIRNYTVSYTRAPPTTPTSDWASVTVPGSQTTVSLSQLSPGTEYFVRVRAATNAGYGKYSEGATLTLLDKTPDPNQTTPPVPLPPTKPTTDQSLGIIVGVSISTCCIIICLSSIYCRQKWENMQSSRDSARSLKDRGILRNGNGCCVERNSTSTSQHAPTAPAVNEIELAVLCPPSPKTNHTEAALSNGIVDGLKQPLLTTWDVNGDTRNLDTCENPQRKPRSTTDSNQELDGTQLSILNYTAAGSGSSLNNNLERSESLSSIQQVPSTSVPVVGPNG